MTPPPLQPEAEFPAADRLLEQTFTDWGEKTQPRKKPKPFYSNQAPLLKQRRDPPQAHTSVRHVGGNLVRHRRSLARHPT